MAAEAIAGTDWPTFGWCDDVRAPMLAAGAAGRRVVLATLYRVEGSAPRGPGAQMMFDGAQAAGYFSGDCIEGDVAAHAAEVLASGVPQRLHYGAGSPWIDIRLRCGGALHVLVERVDPDSPALAMLADSMARRVPCCWQTDGTAQQVQGGDGSPSETPLLEWREEPFQLTRRYDPPRRLVVSGGDPGALALATLAQQSGFETILVRPGGPTEEPPFPVARYLRMDPAEALVLIGVDRWTAYIGATHEDHHDLAACLYAVRHGAAYVGMIGAKSRAEGRRGALSAAGAMADELARLRLSPGIGGLGKNPWAVATGIMAEVMQAMNPARERA